MQYKDAVETLTNQDAIVTCVLVIIAALILFILAGQAIKMWRDIFSKPKKAEDAQYNEHCESSEKRFKSVEDANAENRAYINDLREGQRVLCLACMAILNHDLHNGNSAEIQDALASINGYLTSRP